MKQPLLWATRWFTLGLAGAITAIVITEVVL